MTKYLNIQLIIHLFSEVFSSFVHSRVYLTAFSVERTKRPYCSVQSSVLVTILTFEPTFFTNLLKPAVETSFKLKMPKTGDDFIDLAPRRSLRLSQKSPVPTSVTPMKLRRRNSTSSETNTPTQPKPAPTRRLSLDEDKRSKHGKLAEKKDLLPVCEEESNSSDDLCIMINDEITDIKLTDSCRKSKSHKNDDEKPTRSLRSRDADKKPAEIDKKETPGGISTRSLRLRKRSDSLDSETGAVQMQSIEIESSSQEIVISSQEEEQRRQEDSQNKEGDATKSPKITRASSGNAKDFSVLDTNENTSKVTEEKDKNTEDSFNLPKESPKPLRATRSSTQRTSESQDEKGIPKTKSLVEKTVEKTKDNTSTQPELAEIKALNVRSLRNRSLTPRTSESSEKDENVDKTSPKILKSARSSTPRTSESSDKDQKNDTVAPSPKVVLRSTPSSSSKKLNYDKADSSKVAQSPKTLRVTRSSTPVVFESPEKPKASDKETNTAEPEDADTNKENASADSLQNKTTDLDVSETDSKQEQEPKQSTAESKSKPVNGDEKCGMFETDFDFDDIDDKVCAKSDQISESKRKSARLSKTASDLEAETMTMSQIMDYFNTDTNLRRSPRINKGCAKSCQCTVCKDSNKELSVKLQRLSTTSNQVEDKKAEEIAVKPPNFTGEPKEDESGDVDAENIKNTAASVDEKPEEIPSDNEIPVSQLSGTDIIDSMKKIHLDSDVLTQKKVEDSTNPDTNGSSDEEHSSETVKEVEDSSENDVDNLVSQMMNSFVDEVKKDLSISDLITKDTEVKLSTPKVTVQKTPEPVKKSHSTPEKKTAAPKSPSRGIPTSVHLKIDELIKDVQESSEEDEESQDEDEELQNNSFVLSMAEEGEEDTPSEGSNDIIDDGEEINTTESEITTDESADENDDSFINDNEKFELLPGDEGDLGIEEDEKKSRIIQFDSDGESDTIVTIKRKNIKSPPANKSLKTRISRRPTDDSDDEAIQGENDEETPEEVSEKTAKALKKEENKIVILENITLKEPEVAEDNVEDENDVSDEEEEQEDEENEQEDEEKVQEYEEQDQEDNEVEEIPINDNDSDNSVSEEECKRQINKKIVILEDITMHDIRSKRLSDEIHQVMNVFCSEIKKRGSVSVNLALDYTAQSSDDENPADTTVKVPKRKRNKKKAQAQKEEKTVQLEVAHLKKGHNEEDNKTDSKKRKKNKKRKQNEENTVQSEEVVQSKKIKIAEENQEADSGGKKLKKKNKRNRKQQQNTETVEEAVQTTKEVEKSSNKNKKRKVDSKQVENPIPNKKQKKQNVEPENGMGIFEQAIVDAESRRTQTSGDPIFLDGWEIKTFVDQLKPTAIEKLSKKKKSKKPSFEGNTIDEFHHKDFKNKTLYDRARVSRMETKLLLKKRAK